VPWPLYVSSVPDEQYDKSGRAGGATSDRVDGRMAAWRRSGASGPQLVASYPRRGARTMRPLHHQVGL